MESETRAPILCVHYQCVRVCSQWGREEGGVDPSKELFPVVVTSCTLTASHYFTAAAISPFVLSERDTLTCLSPPLSLSPPLLLPLSLSLSAYSAELPSSSPHHRATSAALLSAWRGHWTAPHPLILHDCHKGKTASDGEQLSICHQG